MKRQFFLLLSLSFSCMYSMQKEKYSFEHNLEVMAELRKYRDVYFQYDPEASKQEINVYIAQIRNYKISEQEKNAALAMICAQTNALHSRYEKK